MSAHLRPTAPIAADALLPGDPGRALALAQALLDRPRMSNHHRGLWGYVGTTAEGRELTIQSTGIGGPSAAIVLAELARHGVRRAIRLGTCIALDGRAPPGAAIVPEAALGGEGASRALGAGEASKPDPRLHRRLLAAAGERALAGVVASLDVVSTAPGLEQAGRPLGADALAVEMGTATVFALGARIGVTVAAALVVSEERPAGDALDDARLEQASLELGAVAASALGG